MVSSMFFSWMFFSGVTVVGTINEGLSEGRKVGVSTITGLD